MDVEALVVLRRRYVGLCVVYSKALHRDADEAERLLGEIKRAEREIILWSACVDDSAGRAGQQKKAV